MPYKCEKVVKLEGTMLDRRRKLTEDQKAYIKWLREEEQLSYNALAKQFGVSKRLVIFICNPEIHEKHKAVNRPVQVHKRVERLFSKASQERVRY